MQDTEGTSFWNRQTLGFAALAIAVLIVIAMNFSYYRGSLMTRATSNAYYYDLNNGQLFAAPSAQILPIVSPSDPKDGGASHQSGVLAHVFSCGQCADSTSRFTGWLETYDPEAVETIRKKFGDHAPSTEYLISDLVESGSVMIREPRDDAKWFRIDSKHAQRIIQQASSRCGDPKSMTQCQP